MIKMIKKRLHIFLYFIKHGYKKTIIEINDQKARSVAFEELTSNYCGVESYLNENVIPIYKGKSTKENVISKNIFVFWYDGIDYAPTIVKECYRRIKELYDDYNVVVLDKFNLNIYCSIPKSIYLQLENNDISIQMFSDVVRFNVLKNNGGFWFDSTIMFLTKIDLGIFSSNTFNSICFSTSKKYFVVDNTCCSWSGFFIYSTKNGVLVSCLSECIEKYILEHVHQHKPYFLVDMVFMCAKRNSIDMNILSKVYCSDENMFYFMNNINNKYDDSLLSHCTCIPQKLNWKYNYKKLSSGSLGDYVINEKKFNL